jgi:uncharacterized membrane protein
MIGWAHVYAVTLTVFLGADAVWLAFVGGPLYAAAIGPLLAEQFRILPAVLFYLLHITGILVLVLPRARGAIGAAAAYGAMFGLCTYGTYDLTNHAVLKMWGWPLTLIDMAWGGFVTGLAAAAGAWAQGRSWARSRA